MRKNSPKNTNAIDVECTEYIHNKITVLHLDYRNVDYRPKVKRVDPGGHRTTSGIARIGTPPPLHHGDLEEGRPHKHTRGKLSIHTDRDMMTCKLGREEERLNLLGDDDPDPHLDEAPTAWRERGPRTAQHREA